MKLKQSTKSQISTADYQCFVAEMPLLYEIGAEKQFDLVIGVVADPAQCKARMQMHKADSVEDYEQTDAKTTNNKADRADVVIVNNGTIQN